MFIIVCTVSALLSSDRLLTFLAFPLPRLSSPSLILSCNIRLLPDSVSKYLYTLLFTLLFRSVFSILYHGLCRPKRLALMAT